MAKNDVRIKDILHHLLQVDTSHFKGRQIGPSDAIGNKCILVIIDAYAFLVPIRDLFATIAAIVLLKFIGTFKLPSAIVSDNDSQFVNETIKSLCEALQVEHLRINAYSHKENGTRF